MFALATLLPALLAAGPLEPMSVKSRRLEARQTLARALRSAGVESPELSAVQSALGGVGFDFRRARAGDQLRTVFRAGRLERLDYHRSPLLEWQVRREGERWFARRREVEIERSVALVELVVETSVWDATVEAGERPDIAVALSDVFAWDIDFYRDVQAGDRMRAVVEKRLHRGRVVGYGAIEAAEYVGSSVGRKRTFRYRLPDGTESYFAEDGTSSRKTFLKSPLKFAPVTSRFGGRLHPILKSFGAHNGVDYGTPIGTPVWAVADGLVTRAGWDKGGGNMVCLKHAMSFETCYLHLSRILVREGARVSQKATVGESGNTGLSTGPHLHFGMRRGGRWVNPHNQSFPRAEPIPREALADFRAHISDALRRLDGEKLALGHP